MFYVPNVAWINAVHFFLRNAHLGYIFSGGINSKTPSPGFNFRIKICELWGLRWTLRHRFVNSASGLRPKENLASPAGFKAFEKIFCRLHSLTFNWWSIAMILSRQLWLIKSTKRKQNSSSFQHLSHENHFRNQSQPVPLNAHKAQSFSLFSL